MCTDQYVWESQKDTGQGCRCTIIKPQNMACYVYTPIQSCVLENPHVHAGQYYTANWWAVWLYYTLH